MMISKLYTENCGMIILLIAILTLICMSIVYRIRKISNNEKPVTTFAYRLGAALAAFIIGGGFILVGIPVDYCGWVWMVNPSVKFLLSNEFGITHILYVILGSIGVTLLVVGIIFIIVGCAILLCGIYSYLLFPSMKQPDNVDKEGYMEI